MTSCGFKKITLEGTEEDWVQLREISERLLTRCKPDFAEKWSMSLLPLLDKFVAARKGEVRCLDSLLASCYVNLTYRKIAGRLPILEQHV